MQTMKSVQTGAPGAIVRHVTVADVIPTRLETALAVGADAVIDSSHEDVTARLTELHGQGANALGQP